MIRARLALIVLLIAAVAPTAGVARLIEVDAWIGPVATTLGVAGLMLALLRSRGGHPATASGWALLAGALAAMTVENPDDRWMLVPSPELIVAVPERLQAAVTTLSSQTPPISPDAGIGLIIAFPVLLFFLAAELLAVGCQAPAWAGFPLVALWLPPILWSTPVPGWSVATAIAAYVALLGILARSDVAAATSRSTITATGCTVAALIVTVVAVPQVLALDVPRTHADIGGLTSARRLDLGLNLRDDLLRGRNRPAFSYTGMTPAELGPLHTYTMSYFNGRTWERTDPDEDDFVATSQLWPEAMTVPSDSAQVTITVPQELGENLPMPEVPRVAEQTLAYAEELDEVAADASWLDDAGPGSLRQESGPVEYDLTLAEPPESQEFWKDLDPRAADQDDQYLQVPTSDFTDDIAELAETIVDDAEAATPYDQVLAIQNYLRNNSDFQYTTAVGPERSDDAVWDFLNDGRGYCVQFATTMTIMVRTLGIEARMAVGYLPGEENDDGDGGTVYAHDAHAWPQVRFPDAGWVHFEPTPSARTSSAPDWAPDPQDEESTDTPESETDSQESESTSESSSTAETSTSAAPTGQNTDDSTSVGWFALAALIVVGTLAAVLFWRRRGRTDRSIDGIWVRVVNRLVAADLLATSVVTPAQVVAQVGDQLDPGGARALTELADAVIAHRYRPGGTEVSLPELDHWREQIETSISSGDAAKA